MKSRFLASAKLSDHRFKRMVRLYAEGISASDAAVALKLSYPTVRGLYQQVRSRMQEVGLYRDADEYRQFMRQWADDKEIDAHFRLIEGQMGKRRGATDATRTLHLAELLYRHDEGSRLGAQFADVHYSKLILLIRLTGPLNRPLTDEARTRAQDYLFNSIASELRSLYTPDILSRDGNEIARHMQLNRLFWELFRH